MAKPKNQKPPFALRALAAFAVTLAALFVLLLAAYALPGEPVRDHVYDSAVKIAGEGLYPEYLNFKLFQMDNYTDTIMLTEAASADEAPPLTAMMTNTAYNVDNFETLADDLQWYIERDWAAGAQRTDAPALVPFSYARYWHGYLIWLRPLLLVTDITGVRVVRAFDKEKSEVERFDNANDLLTKMQLHVGHISALMNPLTYVLINIAIVALLYVGSIEINAGGMASGDVIALVNYMNQILIELVKLANLIVQVSKALACAGRVQAVLDTKPGMDFPAELRSEVPADKAGDAVHFDHVSLTYAGAGAPSLSDISFTAKRGQTIGVIGGTGSGKSSLVNLIPRFYDATEGTVEILGRPAADYPREALRGKVNVVMQKAQLFGGTIRSNLLWGNKNATDAELWAALETAQAAEFVQAKPLGLDEPVEQGGRNLSGGQKQRLTIARALVGKPDILILDDSASALDYATDAALRKALAALPGSLTVFIVSQRAASLQHADQILVLDDGRLVGLGTHDQLRQSCPVYEEIYESQFKKGDVQK